MNPTLEHLIVLQAQDLELKRLREELAEAPRLVTAAQTARAKAEVALNNAKTALAKEEVLRRSQQTDALDRRNKIARLRKQMETATSAAQITALEHEISFAEQTITKLEDDELASMERTERLEAEQSAGTELLAEKTAALASTRASSAATTTHHTVAITALEDDRKSLRAEISATDEGERALSVYDRVAKAKGTGVAEARDHKCSACQMLVRPQRWNDLTGRDFTDIIFNCETCGRMLFWDPRRDAPGPWPAGDRLASAIGVR